MANKLIEALDPRVPIYRDSYNEYFVMVLSAGGARQAGRRSPVGVGSGRGRFACGAGVAGAAVREPALDVRRAGLRSGRWS